MLTKKKKLLFICTENLQRSPTAEELVNTSPKFKDYTARSAGTSITAVSQITKTLIEWSDIIFVFNEKYEKHKTILLKKFPNLKKKIIDLDIPDRYYRNDPELIKILKIKLKKYLYM
ncbi:MAG: phosphotyrosine protein phosphatase [Nanoarchaeota archaeon]